MDPIRADLFCRVIDNLGDIGVTWRLARQLTTEKHWEVRLWVDDLVAFKRLLPAIDPSLPVQKHQSVVIGHWTDQWDTATTPNPVVIAGFSCDLPEPFIKKMASSDSPTWLQLEYLSAESWVSEFHNRTSSRADGLTPVFFFPGFEPNTGGLLREAGLIEQRQQWQADPRATHDWLRSLGVDLAPTEQNPRLVSLFCYPDASLTALHAALQAWNAPTKVLVPAGQPIPPSLVETTEDQVSWHQIQFLSQPDYDRLLWTMDLNFVRGEDSFVRGIWAGRPLVWQPYPQSELTHLNKLDAWLAKSNLPSKVQMLMRQWSQGGCNDLFSQSLANALNSDTWAQWQARSTQQSHALAQQIDLASQIDQYCRRT